MFALPQPDGRVYVGLTDEPVDGPMPDVPEPPEGDIGFLLDVIGSALEVPLRRDDMVGRVRGPAPAAPRRARRHRRHLPQARGAAPRPTAS